MEELQSERKKKQSVLRSVAAFAASSPREHEQQKEEKDAGRDAAPVCSRPIESRRRPAVFCTTNAPGCGVQGQSCRILRGAGLDGAPAHGPRKPR